MRPTWAPTFLLVLIACNLKEAIDKAKVVNDDLIKTFNHKDINTSIGWGTDNEDNHVLVTFFNYELDVKSYKELETLASKVRGRILEQNPGFKDLDNIEIRFTKAQNTDDLNEYVTFKSKNE